MSDYLPEEVIVKILTKLPVKSLIRFTSVSKRWRAIILDQQFAKSHYKERPANRRLLIISNRSQPPKLFKSLDLETVSSFEDIRKLNSLFMQEVYPLGSCHGLICLTETRYSTTPYIWNPSTGMLQKLPHPGFSKEREKTGIMYSGFGYCSATDDYKVVVSTFCFCDKDPWDVEVFSFRARVWKRIQLPDPGIHRCWNNWNHQGLVLNEAFHWLCPHGDYSMSVLALDLATDQFRTMPLPKFFHESDLDHSYPSINIFVSGGCLHLFRCVGMATGYDWLDKDSVVLWIMSEYGVPDSWTMVFKYGVSNQFECTTELTPLFVMETSTIVDEWSMDYDIHQVVRLHHEEGTPVVNQRYDCCRNESPLIVYEDSLLWIDDGYGEEERVKRAKTKHEASGSRNEEK